MQPKVHEKAITQKDVEVKADRLAGDGQKGVLADKPAWRCKVCQRSQS